MKCPHCGSSERQRVLKTESGDDGKIVRRRQCPDCRHDFKTTERLSDAGLKVRKSDGSVEPFSRDKLATSIRKGTVRDYSAQRLDEVIDRVQATVFPLSARGPIPSARIGSSVLAELKDADPSSHIRFALVYAGGWSEQDDQVAWSNVSAVRKWLGQEYPEFTRTAALARPITVVKKDGRRVPFERQKLERSIGLSSKGRGTRDQVRAFANEISDEVERVFRDQNLLTSSQISSEVMRILVEEDHLAYLRYASTAKAFASPEDYVAEVEALFRLGNS